MSKHEKRAADDAMTIVRELLLWNIYDRYTNTAGPTVAELRKPLDKSEQISGAGLLFKVAPTFVGPQYGNCFM